MAKTAYIADRIFTGDDWLKGHAIIIEKDKVLQLLPVVSLPGNIRKIEYNQGILAPAFIDLQIYGAGGRLLAVYPDSDTLEKIVEYSAAGGAFYCMPTLATNTKEIYFKAIDAIRNYWKKNGKGILGLHLEGPWINPAKKGAHIAELIHAPALDEVLEILEYGKGVIKMITLAPEVCSKEILELILSENIIISAGHSYATYQEAMESFSNGVSCVTHLFNAMGPWHHREPGLAGACFDSHDVYASIIPDGYHVDYSIIRIARKLMHERLFIITDAVTETRSGYYQHQRAGDKFEVAGTLSGSALDMAKGVRNLVQHGIEPGEALRMASYYPARVLGLDHIYGKLEPGYHSHFVVMDEDFNYVYLNTKN